MTCSSTSKNVKEKEKDNNYKEELLKHKKCNYKCKKEVSMKKHMLTNHEDQQCKECQEKLSTFMELLKNVAIHHFKDEGDIEDKNFKEKECNKKQHKQNNTVEEADREKTLDVL